MVENIKLPLKVVVDASVILALLLPDEKTDLPTEKLLKKYREKKLQLVSSSLLPYEVLNGIKSAIIKKRISREIGQKLIKSFLKLKIETRKVNFNKVFEDSLHYSLSIYDAAYATLAKKSKLPLITFDEKLAQKVKKDIKALSIG